MAISYPGYSVPQPVDLTLLDVAQSWKNGVQRGQDQRFQEQAPGLIQQNLADLAPYGLDPAKVGQLYANPNTMDLARLQIQDATGRRNDATDPMRQLQLEKARIDVANAKRGPGPVDPTSTVQGRAQLAQQYGLSGDALKTYVLTGKLPDGQGGAAGLGLNPVWGTDQQGNSVIMQIGKDGSAVRTQLPEGVTPTNPYDLAGQKAGGAADAKTAAAARAALPGVEQGVQITRQAIDLLRNDQAGMKEWFGQVGPRGIYVNPGSPMGNFVANTKQILGQAFMQARQGLKGGGQITDYEGRRAEAAYSRIESALAQGDQNAFLSALGDFEQAVQTGYEKLQQQAGPATGGQGRTQGGVTWSVE